MITSGAREARPGALRERRPGRSAEPARRGQGGGSARGAQEGRDQVRPAVGREGATASRCRQSAGALFVSHPPTAPIKGRHPPALRKRPADTHQPASKRPALALRSARPSRGPARPASPTPSRGRGQAGRVSPSRSRTRETHALPQRQARRAACWMAYGGSDNYPTRIRRAPVANDRARPQKAVRDGLILTRMGQQPRWGARLTS